MTRWTRGIATEVAIYGVCFAIACAILWPVLNDSVFFSHPDFSGIYFPFRQWFIEHLRQGYFPFWNFHWGLGNFAVIWSTVPIDQFTLFELVGIHRYTLFLALNFAALIFCLYKMSEADLSRPFSLMPPALFILAPWVNYFVFYFIKLNSFISLVLAWYFLGRFMIAPVRKYFLGIVLAGLISGLGTKLEYVYFSVLSWLFLSFIISMSRGRFEFNKFIRVQFAFFLGLSVNAYSLYLVVHAASESYRSEALESGLFQLFNPDFYIKITEFSRHSGFTYLVSIILVLLGIYLSNASARRFWPSGIFAVPFLILTYLRRVDVSAQLEFLGTIDTIYRSYYFYGLILSVAFMFRNLRRENLISLMLVLVPLYYWGRSFTEIGEGDLIRSAPPIYQISLGFLVGLGSLAFPRSRKVFIPISLVAFWLLMRDQGNIITSHLTGAMLFPTRDNFVIDFALVLVSVRGLSELTNRLSSKRVQWGLIAIWFLLALFSHSKGYHSIHPLFADGLGYSEESGIPELKDLLNELNLITDQRVLFISPISLKRPMFYGTTLLKNVDEPGIYQSLIHGRFLEWANTEKYGLTPGRRPYFSGFSPREEAKLPSHYSPVEKFPEGDHYAAIVHFEPVLAPEWLNFFRVRYIISESELPDPSLALSRYRFGYYVYEWLPTYAKFNILVPGKLDSLDRHSLPLNEFIKFVGTNAEDGAIQRVTNHGPNEVSMDINGKKSFDLLTQIPFGSDWIVHVDGVRVEAKVANGTFLFVSNLVPGLHHLKMHYRPRHFSIFLYISSLACLMTLSLTVLAIHSPEKEL